MEALLTKIKNCRECVNFLPEGPNPVLAMHSESKILLIGHAPGRIVHASGIPWQDKSGDNLRSWIGVDKNVFYDPRMIGIMPMGFCYPGTGKSGDMPPRKECAPLWHEQLLHKMENVQLVLLIGRHAQEYYLKGKMKRNLTETVKAYPEYLPLYMPLPHPSPRNNIWQKRNPWFKELLLPELKLIINEAICR